MNQSVKCCLASMKLSSLQLHQKPQLWVSVLLAVSNKPPNVNLFLTSHTTSTLRVKCQLTDEIYYVQCQAICLSQ